MVSSTAVDDGNIPSVDSDKGFNEFLKFLGEPSDVSRTHGDEKEEETIEENNNGSSYEKQTDEDFAKTPEIGLVDSRSSRFESFLRFIEKPSDVSTPHGKEKEEETAEGDNKGASYGEQTDEGLLPQAAAIEKVYVESSSPKPFDQAKTEKILSGKTAKMAADELVNSMTSSPELMADAEVMETGPGEVVDATAIGAVGTRSSNPEDVDINEAEDVETATIEEVFARSPRPEFVNENEAEDVETAANREVFARSPSPEDVDINVAEDVETAANGEVFSRSLSPESLHYEEISKSGPMKESMREAAVDVAVAESAPREHLVKAEVQVKTTDKSMKAASRTVYSKSPSAEHKEGNTKISGNDHELKVEYRAKSPSNAAFATVVFGVLMGISLLAGVFVFYNGVLKVPGNYGEDEAGSSLDKLTRAAATEEIQYHAKSLGSVVVVAAIGTVVVVSSYIGAILLCIMLNNVKVVDSISFVMKIGLVFGVFGYFYYGVLNATDHLISPRDVGLSSSLDNLPGLKYPSSEPLIQAESGDMIGLIKIVKSAAIGLAYSSLQTPEPLNGTVMETGMDELMKVVSVEAVERMYPTPEGVSNQSEAEETLVVKTTASEDVNKAEHDETEANTSAERADEKMENIVNENEPEVTTDYHAKSRGNSVIDAPIGVAMGISSYFSTVLLCIMVNSVSVVEAIGVVMRIGLLAGISVYFYYGVLNEPDYLVAPGSLDKLTESAVLEEIVLKYPSHKPLIQAEPETIGLFKRVKSAATKMMERSPEPLIQAEPEMTGLFKLAKSEATKRLNLKRLSNIVPFLNKRSLNKDDGTENSGNESDPEMKTENSAKSRSNVVVVAAIDVMMGMSIFCSTIIMCIMLGL